jgi:hypothetical protein
MTTESYYTPIAFDAKSNIVDHYNLTYETRNSDLFTIYEHHFDKWYDTVHNSIAVDNYTATTNSDERKKYHKYIYFGKYYCVNIVITDLEYNSEVYSVKITADSINPDEGSGIEADREYKSITDCIITCRDIIIDMNAEVNYHYLEELCEDCNIEYARDHM